MSEAADLSSWMKTPHRIAVDARGYVWRAYTDLPYWSMAPVNPDNNPIPEPLTFYVPESGLKETGAVVNKDIRDKRLELAQAADQLLDRIPQMNIYEAVGVLTIVVRELAKAVASE